MAVNECGRGCSPQDAKFYDDLAEENKESIRRAEEVGETIPSEVVFNDECGCGYAPQDAKFHDDLIVDEVKN